MQRDPAIHRKRIAAMQPIAGWQCEPRDPFIKQYRPICVGNTLQAASERRGEDIIHW